MKWRVWVLVALLGAAVVAGAFLLPHGAEPSSELAAAARAVLSLNGYRTKVRLGAGYVQVEDVGAPDRLRTVFDVGDAKQQSIVIGLTRYTEALNCINGTGYVMRHDPKPMHGLGEAVLNDLTEMPSTRIGARGPRRHYDVTPTASRRRTGPITVSVVDLDAFVVRGKVRNATLVLHYTQGRKSSTQAIHLTYSDFDHVPPIRAPQRSELLPEDFRCELRLTPVG